MSSVAEKLNLSGMIASIVGVVSLVSFYGFKTATEISSVFLATENRDLFEIIADYSIYAGFAAFGLGLVLSGVGSFLRRDEMEKKDLVLGLGIPVLGLTVLLGDFFLF